MAEWVSVPMVYEPWPGGASDVFTKSTTQIVAPVVARDTVISPRQAFFEEKLKAISWVIGSDRIPTMLNFEGELRQLDRGCVGHAVANGILLEPTNGPSGYIEFVELRSPPNKAPHSAVELWRAYRREEIPPLFGLEFNTGSWQQGFLVQGRDVFLLVTLDKSEHADEFQYEDAFLSETVFRWQSQNRTRQSSSHGRIISGEELGYRLHLFVRPSRLENGKAGRFTYFGELGFIEWQGEQPITVRFRLNSAVPQKLWPIFDIQQKP